MSLAILGDTPPKSDDPIWGWAWAAMGETEAAVLERARERASRTDRPKWLWERLGETAERMGWTEVRAGVREALAPRRTDDLKKDDLKEESP